MACSNHRGLALFCIITVLVSALSSQQTNAQAEIGGGGLVSGFLKDRAKKIFGNAGSDAQSPATNDGSKSGNANAQSYEDQKAILGGDWRLMGH
ncbi:hypothetical protein AgCh_003633 [Apium graveolens]